MKKTFHRIGICGILLALLLAAGFTLHSSAVTVRADTKNGFVTVSGKKYYYQSGKKYTGWLTLDDKKYYFRKSDGLMLTGWIKSSSGKARYFDPSTGVMATGFKKISGKKYYFSAGTGYAASGWVTSKYNGNKRYFSTKDFSMATGWKYNSDKTKRWYFDKTTGVLYTGLKQVGTKWYYFNGTNSCAVSGWMKDSNGDYRYFSKTTFAMMTGWVKSGTQRRYFDPDTGIMYKRLRKIDGKYYYFDSKGLALTGWVNFTGGKRYFSTSTYAMVTGTVTIDDISYTFDSKGYLISSGNYWTQQLLTYQKDSTVQQLLMVQYDSGTRADVIYYRKNSSGNWVKDFSCEGYVGSGGLNKTREGDYKTPTGVFTPTCAFGILKNPGAKMDYTQVTKYHYWCSDKQWYNQLIDTRTQSHTCSGEHLIDYTTLYNYAINIGYNTDNVYKKGSAIFLHCVKTGRYYTGGCIAIPQTNMKEVVTTMTNTAKIIIRKK